MTGSILAYPRRDFSDNLTLAMRMLVSLMLLVKVLEPIISETLSKKEIGLSLLLGQMKVSMGFTSTPTRHRSSGEGLLTIYTYPILGHVSLKLERLSTWLF